MITPPSISQTHQYLRADNGNFSLMSMQNGIINFFKLSGITKHDVIQPKGSWGSSHVSEKSVSLRRSIWDREPRKVRDVYPIFRYAQVNQFWAFFQRIKNPVENEKGSFGIVIEAQILSALTTF